jgi:sigma-B regulation protein RsbU (phosphoserine phosphatase)
MDRLNGVLYESTQANKFVTLFYGELEPRDGTFRYVRGGHVPPYLVRKDGSIDRLDAGGPALGLLDDAEFAEGVARLAPGDTLAIVTDGATEAMTATGEELGDAGVCRALREVKGPTADDVLQTLLRAVERWTGPPGCSDDLTALILKAEEP